MRIPTDRDPFDPAQLSQSITQVAERSQKLLFEFLATPPEFSAADVAHANAIGSAFLSLTVRMMSDPMSFVTATFDLWSRFATLWLPTAAGDGSHQDLRDHRFKDPAWVDNPIFEFIKQSYLICADSILSTVRGVKGPSSSRAEPFEGAAVTKTAPTIFSHKFHRSYFSGPMRAVGRFRV